MSKKQRKNTRKKCAQNVRVNPHKNRHKNTQKGWISAVLASPLLSIIKLDQFPFVVLIALVLLAYCYMYKK